jgi:hypothetical protein
MILKGENWKTQRNQVPVPVCPPKILPGLPWATDLGLTVEKPGTNCLCSGLASAVPLLFSVKHFVTSHNWNIL